MGAYCLAACSSCGKVRRMQIIRGKPRFARCLRCAIHETNFKGINLAEKNGQWKGDDVGYSSLHDWIRMRLIKPLVCQHCGIRLPYDLANKNGNYVRDLSEWWWLCRKCHMELDGRLVNLRLKRKEYQKRIAESKGRLKNGNRSADYIPEGKGKVPTVRTGADGRGNGNRQTG